MLEAGAELARVELKEEVDIEHYSNVPTIGSERLEITFIEVATAECGRGIGTQVVRGAGAAASRSAAAGLQRGGGRVLV